jgi:GNAT superfamily N-acetyltransferase
VREKTTIRPGSEGDLTALARHLPRHRRKHLERLEQQRRGRARYLIAWRGDLPVGHVLLRSPGEAGTDPGRQLGCAEVEDLYVGAGHRRRGIGALLLEAAEAEAARRGHGALGLAVEVANRPARALYERHGYAGSSHGEFILRGSSIGDDGQDYEWEQTCLYLVKSLEQRA